MEDNVLKADIKNQLEISGYFSDSSIFEINIVSKSNRKVSNIYQLEINATNGRELYWLKYRKQPEKEFEFLHNACSRFSGKKGISSVEPVCLTQNPPGILTRHHHGKLYSSVIKTQCNRLVTTLIVPDKSIEVAYRCGSLLAELHREEEIHSSHYSKEELREYIHLRLVDAAKRFRLIKNSLKLIEDVVDSLVEDISTQELTRVRTHGDFAPYNILVAEEDLCVFDPNVGGYVGRQNGFCSKYEDLVHCYNYLESMAHYLISRNTRRILADSFVAGYSRDSSCLITTTSSVFKLFQVKYKLLDLLKIKKNTLQLISNRKSALFLSWIKSIA